MPAHILYETDRVVIRFSYDADLVEALKVRIPSTYRKWSPEEKSWTVTGKWQETAANLIRKHFGDSRVSVDDRRPGASKATPPPDGAYVPPGAPPPRTGSDQLIEELRTQLSREKLARQSAQRDADRFRAMAAGRSASSGGDWAAELYRQLPDGMRDGTYKKLLTALHPDVNGGSPEAVALTKALNNAFRTPKSGR